MLRCLAFSAVIGIAVAYNQLDVADSGTGNNRGVVWTGGSFDWPSVITKNMYKSSGHYISKNVIATRSVIYKDDAIVALPRLKPGVPATLAKVSKKKNGQVVLVPYPTWTLQEEGNCEALQSVVDIFLDAQDILWALDTGVVNSHKNPVRKCSPKVMAIDVNTGKVLKVVDLGSLATKSSRLQYVIVDYSLDGRNFIYVTDAVTRAILVYDVTSAHGHRFILPKATTMRGLKCDVLYASLIHHHDGTTSLIFSYLSSDRLFSIKTETLQNSSTSRKIHDFGVKPKKMVILGTDNGSAIFFRYEGDTIIYRWDCYTPFVAANFLKVSSSNDPCSLPTQVIPDYNRGRMRVLESNFPDFVHDTVGCGVNHALNIL